MAEMIPKSDVMRLAERRQAQRDFHEGIELISFSRSSEREGSFLVSIIGFSGFITVSHHARHQ